MDIVAASVHERPPSAIHDDIQAWQDATFPDADNLGGFEKLCEEVVELNVALANYDGVEDPHEITEARAHLEEELADCFIILSSLASRNNIDIERCAREKLAVNMARPRDADGNRIRD
jgi:NTP pyrophosphatase (non-canonical NTP hydrolase)